MEDKFFLFINVKRQALEKINAWINSKCFQNPVVIFDHLGELNRQDFGCPAFSELDVIPTNSQKEEEVYEEVWHKKNCLKNDLILNFNRINLTADLCDYAGISFESNIRFAKAVAQLYQQGHDVVIACLTYYSFYTYAILDEAIACGLANPKSMPYKYNLIEDKLYEDLDFRVKERHFFHEWKDLFSTILKELKKIEIFQHIFGSNHVPSSEVKKDDAMLFELRKGKPLLFLSSTSMLYVNNFLPVYRTLCRRLNEVPCLLGKSYLQEFAIKHDLPLMTLDNFDQFNIKSLVQMILCLIKGHFYKTSVRYARLGGNTFEHILNRFLKSPQFISELFRIGKDALAIDFIISKMQPTCLYKQVSITVFDTILNSLAKIYRIPVISSVHASIDEKYRNFSIRETDYITLLGKEQITPFLKRGFVREQLIPVGQPELDEALNNWDKASSLEFMKNQFPQYCPTKKIFLVATSCLDRQNEMTWLKELSTLLEKTNVQVFIKPHPSCTHYYEALEETTNFIVAPSSLSLYPFLQLADWVITDVSHAGKLAIFFNKKLIVVNCSGSEFPYSRFDVEGLALSVRSLQQLKVIVLQCLNGEEADLRSNYPPYIKQCFYANDGKASERIVDFLMSFGQKRD